MKILAIDTATERCSVALRIDSYTNERSIETARGHAELVLPMVAEVLAEGNVLLRDLDGIAFGRGPGAFTGVRITVGVVQGLAFGANVPVVGISNLAAVAQQVARQDMGAGEQILVCMDARMGEVYWGRFTRSADNGLVEAAGPESVDHPDQVDAGAVAVFAGTGFKVSPRLVAAAGGTTIHDVLPRAREIALLGESALHAGHGRPAAEAQPIYLRDQVAGVKRT